MTKEEVFEKWCELTNAYTEKEAKLQEEIQRWLYDDDSAISNESMEHLIDTTNQQAEEAKVAASQLWVEYAKIIEDEKLREKSLMTVKSQFGISPDEIIITGGVLSPNASESHLIGRTKTPEELEEDRQYALAQIRTRVAKKEISLAEASKLKNDVNIAYGKTNEEMSSGMHM